MFWYILTRRHLHKKLTEPPTKASLSLLDFLAACDSSDAVDVFLPVTLAMLRKSENYAMIADYSPQEIANQSQTNSAEQPAAANAPQHGTMPRPCSLAFAVVVATTKTKITKLDDDGLKLTNHGVKDVMGDAPDKSFTITTFCTLDNLQDFKLEPPRGSPSQYALIVIADVLDNQSPEPNFIAESITLVSPMDIDAIKMSMNQLLYYVASAANMTGQKREWDDNFSPTKAKRCRTLGRAPTEAALPEYKTINAVASSNSAA